MYFRNALKENVQLIKENELPMLSNGAFPTRSPFRDSALYDIIIGGEPFRLSWPWGIEEPDHETGELIIQTFAARTVKAPANTCVSLAALQPTL